MSLFQQLQCWPRAASQVRIPLNRAAYSTVRRRIEKRRSLIKKLKTLAETHEAVDIISADSMLNKSVQVPPDGAVPKLTHGLDRVLFSPGVHFLQDPRSKIYNFDKFLERISPPSELDYARLPSFTRPSKHDEFLDMARRTGKRFAGSTSSMTSALSQMYYAISMWKPADTAFLSQAFPKRFTRLTTAPISILLRWRDGVYAIDSDEKFGRETVLTMLGHSLEKFLTSTPEEFARYRMGSEELPTDNPSSAELSYHYAEMDKFLLRSQLDCQDNRLPGKTFDLKTRAVLAVRMDHAHLEDYQGYQLRRLHGLFESYEREYYDMIRAPMLKYNFQARIGHMDGVFVAYHNTFRMFGFQYLSLQEMDARLFGNSRTGQQAFNLSMMTLSRFVETATKQYPEQSLRLTLHARQGCPVVDMFVETIDETAEAMANAAASNGSVPTTAQDQERIKEQEMGEVFSTQDTSGSSNSVSKFTMSLKSMIGDKEVSEPVTLNPLGKEPWRLRVLLNRDTRDEAKVRKEYQELRHHMMAVYGDPDGTSEVDDADLKQREEKRRSRGLVGQLRRISDRRLAELKQGAPAEF